MSRKKPLKAHDCLTKLSWEQLYSLDRQTIRAHRMEIDWSASGIDKKRTDPTFSKYEGISLTAFAILFGGHKKKRLTSEEWFQFVELSPAGIYFLTWLSLLYTVIQKLRSELRRVGCTDLSFLRHYDPALVRKLYGLRQTMFHVPTYYWDQNRLYHVLEPGIAKKAWLLHKEIMDQLTAALKEVRPDSMSSKRFAELMGRLSDEPT